MTAAIRLRIALAALHWTQRGLAAVLRRDERGVRRWLSGDYEPPADLLAWLETLAAFHRDNPPPAPQHPASGLPGRRERQGRREG